MATAGVFTSTQAVNSAKFDSITVLKNTELQGTITDNTLKIGQKNVSCDVRKISTQAYVDTVRADVTGWQTANYDVSATFNTTTGEWICPVTGLWLIRATLDWAPSAVGIRSLGFTGTAATGNNTILGTTVNATSSGDTFESVTLVLACTRLSNLILNGTEVTGGALNLNGAAFSATLLYRTA